MPDEIFASEDFIRVTLAADTALRTAFLPFIAPADQAAFVLASRVHIGSAPQGAVFPLIKIQFVSAPVDTRQSSIIRIFARPMFLVTAVLDKRSYKDIRPIVDRLDTLLHGAKGSGLGGTVLTLYREIPFQRAVVEGGVTHSESGGYYRAVTQAA